MSFNYTITNPECVLHVCGCQHFRGYRNNAQVFLKDPDFRAACFTEVFPKKTADNETCRSPSYPHLMEKLIWANCHRAVYRLSCPGPDTAMAKKCSPFAGCRIYFRLVPRTPGLRPVFHGWLLIMTACIRGCYCSRMWQAIKAILNYNKILWHLLYSN